MPHRLHTYRFSVQNSIFLSVFPSHRSWVISQVFDEIDQSHMSMIRVANKLLHPPTAGDKTES